MPQHITALKEAFQQKQNVTLGKTQRLSFFLTMFDGIMLGGIMQSGSMQSGIMQCRGATYMQRWLSVLDFPDEPARSLTSTNVEKYSSKQV